jgi:glycosyltransferase involved in cell wall biosynthesis
MVEKLRVGVVIAAYDMAAWIGSCLSSLIGQTHRDWTAIVVDDGSRDGTAAVVGGFRDPRIRLIRQHNAGVSAARNRGLAEVAGEAVLFLDADDWLAPDALARMAHVLATHPWAVAAWGRYALMAPNAGPGDRPLRVCRPTLPDGDALAAMMVGNRFANGGHVLVRRDAVARAGLFDTRLCFGEDWEYWVRLALAGPFVPVAGTAPLLFVRRRPSGAYASRAEDVASFQPPLRAIFENPDIRARFSARRLAALHRAAQAEAAWIAGRARLGGGEPAGGFGLLFRSIRSAPSLRRVALLPILHLGAMRRG